MLELGGGNDSLNTVVPLDDPAYRLLRPRLGVTDPIALDSTVGLAPQLARLAERYRRGQVALIEGIGYPEPNLSHFASLASWWTGNPGTAGGTGWIGRYLDGTVGYDDPLAGIGIGPIPSPALLGAASFATSIVDARGLQPSVPAWVENVDQLVAAWGSFAPASPDPTTLLGQLQHSILLTAQARDGLAGELDGFEPASTDDLDPGDGAPGVAGRQHGRRLAAPRRPSDRLRPPAAGRVRQRIR